MQAVRCSTCPVAPSSSAPKPHSLPTLHSRFLQSKQPQRSRVHPGSTRGTRAAAAKPVDGQVGERVMVGEEAEAKEKFASGDREMEIKLDCDESGCVLVVSNNVGGLEEESSEGQLQCSLVGCVYAPETIASEFKVIEGSGWRLGFETAPASEESFSAMVGAGGWSVALTASEFNDFCKLIQMLRKGIITMDQDGVLGKDDIVMQVERGQLWMECVVPRKRLPSLQRFLKFGGRSEASAFDIRFMLSNDTNKRQAEGYWPAEAVMDMLKRIDQLSSPAASSAEAPNGGLAAGVAQPT